MRKGFNTLSEQMGRMKSLFTEERLFGNLVEQEETDDAPKSGTDMEGKTMEKGDRKDNVSQAKSDVKDTKVDIKLNAKECVKSIKNTFKTVNAGIDDEKWKSDNPDILKNIKWCLKTFKNRFEKEGIFKAGDEANSLISSLKLDSNFKLVSGGVEGEKYTIKNEKGRERIFIKKIGNNKFRFRGAKDINLLSGKGIGKTKTFKQEYVDLIKDQLGLEDTSVITVTKGMNNNNWDFGVFIVS